MQHFTSDLELAKLTHGHKHIYAIPTIRHDTLACACGTTRRTCYSDSYGNVLFTTITLHRYIDCYGNVASYTK